MLSKEELEHRAKWPDGTFDKEAATELLALRERLSEQQEPFGYISSLCVRDIHKGNSCPLYPERDEEAGYVIPLFTAAKPVDITCYSCRRFIAFQQHAEADGFCPYCNVEIELTPPATE
ncbi:hypothetical protein [Yersinia enterocolitica]|uniref:hypothetical protein n=1 Tax=Yersinia enterocolitica TaxID=630 RepID=UPI000D893E3C|nr:hypothetical protein [Yersinia enterocolitica]SQA40426.1 Uncharacterised protein [Yersinia enterocolitica]SUP65413.1 Uncharacterised protein [Yersinia enterocolitica]HDM8272768.1 hypothetical protein [Yersinia enterocolitica]HED5565374.1 hypothetical protein [Yersinia enterocolitica]